MLDKDNGVTLIALIVTIIVLIILAGISITTLTKGDQSIINQSRETSNEAQRESIVEKIEADLLKEKIKRGSTPTKEDLKKIIQENGYNEGTIGEDSFVTKDGGYTIKFEEIIGWE